MSPTRTDRTDRLALAPSTVKRALMWVKTRHGRLEPPPGGLFAVAVRKGRRLACIALAGRPVARRLDDGFTVEVTRVASDRTPHAASMAIAAITRAAIALGYRRVVSYTWLGEKGTCFRAAGWRVTALSRGGEWDRPSRPREPATIPGPKARWEFGPTAAPLDAEADRAVREAAASTR